MTTLHRAFLLLLLATVARGIASPIVPVEAQEPSLSLLRTHAARNGSDQTSVVFQGGTSVGLNDDESHKRWLTLVSAIISTYVGLSDGITIAVGLYSLGRSICSTYDDCHDPSNNKGKVNYLFSCLDLVVAAFVGYYQPRGR